MQLNLEKRISLVMMPLVGNFLNLNIKISEFTPVIVIIVAIVVGVKTVLKHVKLAVKPANKLLVCFNLF